MFTSPVTFVPLLNGLPLSGAWFTLPTHKYRQTPIWEVEARSGRLPTTDPCFLALLSMEFLARNEEKWKHRLGLRPYKNFEELLL